MPRKPRLILGTLVTASLAGTYLSWAGAPAPVTGPVASWVATISLGTLLTTSVLWHRYAQRAALRPDWLTRRWTRLRYAAAGAAITSLGVRVVATDELVNAPVSSASVLAVALVFLGGLAAVVRRTGYVRPPRGFAVLGSGAAVAGLVGLAWLNVGTTGGSLERTAVRAVHLVSVGAWIGGAVWHNTVGVPAHAAASATGVTPVLRGFQRMVPVLVVATLATGLHQAVTWLGTNPSTYLGTTVGRLVTLKLVAVLVLATVVARSLLKRRTANG
jgi:hypothetical protein